MFFHRWWRLARKNLLSLSTTSLTSRSRFLSLSPPHNSQHNPTTPPTPTPQAHPRRVARVAKQLEREIGMLLLTDPALRAAVSPPARERERAGSLAGIASVSEVELTANLQLARVYVSVYADAGDRGPAMRALERLQPYVRRRCGTLYYYYYYFLFFLRLCFLKNELTSKTPPPPSLLDQPKSGSRPR